MEPDMSNPKMSPKRKIIAFSINVSDQISLVKSKQNKTLLRIDLNLIYCFTLSHPYRILWPNQHWHYHLVLR